MSYEQETLNTEDVIDTNVAGPEVIPHQVSDFAERPQLVDMPPDPFNKQMHDLVFERGITPTTPKEYLDLSEAYLALGDNKRAQEALHIADALQSQIPEEKSIQKIRFLIDTFLS